jgi:hypothetical protein
VDIKQIEKTVRAKLYNHKSCIDGLIKMIDSGLIVPEKAGEAISKLSVDLVDEIQKFIEDSV